MQSTPLNTTAPKLGREEDAVPGFASDTPHDSLMSGGGQNRKRLRDLATEAVGSVRDIARGARSAAADQVDATASRVSDAARQRPFATVAIAVAAGAVIGLLLARR